MLDYLVGYGANHFRVVSVALDPIFHQKRRLVYVELIERVPIDELDVPYARVNIQIASIVAFVYIDVHLPFGILIN